MRGWVARLLALLAPQVGPDNPDFKGDHPTPIIPCPPSHGHNCNCTWKG